MRRLLLSLILAAGAPRAFSANIAPDAQRLLGDFAAATGQPGLVESMAPLVTPGPVQGQPVKTAAAGPGQFKLVYGPAKSAQAKKWKKILQDSKIYDDNVRKLNEQ